MTASAQIKTPSMDVPLRPGPEAREGGERLKKKFTRVCLSQVRSVDVPLYSGPWEESGYLPQERLRAC